MGSFLLTALSLSILNPRTSIQQLYQAETRQQRIAPTIKETVQQIWLIYLMFRDFKSGGYNLEGTKVSDKRLMTLILLITLAYSQATLCGEIIKNKGIAKYIGRVTEKGRNYPRHSNFYLGLHAIAWVESLQFFAVEIRELMKLSPQKCANYQRGLRAASSIKSTL